MNCTSNQLTFLDVTNNIALTILDVGDNLLTSLDLSNNIALTELEGVTAVSQKEVFSLIEPLLSETQFISFKQNEIKNFININANLVI